MTLTDDVVAKCADVLGEKFYGHVWNRPDHGVRDSYIAFMRNTARAALEAARYGELVEGLRKIADRPGPGYDRWDNLINEDEYMAEIARALLSTIGEQP